MRLLDEPGMLARTLSTRVFRRKLPYWIGKPDHQGKWPVLVHVGSSDHCDYYERSAGQKVMHNQYKRLMQLGKSRAPQVKFRGFVPIDIFGRP
jgi:hypothetical protein